MLSIGVGTKCKNSTQREVFVNIEDFRCPICGGPTSREEKKKTIFSAQEAVFHCLDSKCRTELTQSYDEKSISYSNLLYLADTKRIKSPVWSAYANRKFAPEQWKIIMEGGTITDTNQNFGRTVSVSGPSGEGVELGSTTPVHPEFGTLLGYVVVLKGFGAFLVFLAIIVFFVGMGAPQVGLITGIAGGIALGVTGIGFMASGEAVSCFVSIERNTRVISELLKQLLNKTPD